MMNILAITDNVDEQSLTRAIGRSCLEGAKSAGANADIFDLHDIGFNPVFNQEDRLHYAGKAPTPDDVAAIQRRIAWADVVVLVFPVYWFAMPAMMKGLFDRVLCRGFAFGSTEGSDALHGKVFHVLATVGWPEEMYRSNDLMPNMEHLICRDILKDNCGASQATMTMFYGVDSDTDAEADRQRAEAAIEAAYGVGAYLVSR